MVVHQAEENYLKAIYALTLNSPGASTNQLAEFLNTKASSVTDMAKRLSEKGYVHYTKYKGLSLSRAGKDIALATIRKHRLWEVFLVEKLGFKWDEVHEIAEQLEHIQSETLTNKLDEFLGCPKFDPHGDPIPDRYGLITARSTKLLCDVQPLERSVIVGVKDSSPAFLKYLEAQQLLLGTNLVVEKKFEFDQSLNLQLSDGNRITISQLVSKNIIVRTGE